jgi:predicted PurR-regulated permease PerM
VGLALTHIFRPAHTPLKNPTNRPNKTPPFPPPQTTTHNSLFGVLTIPDIAREGADFVSRLKSDNVWVVLVEKMRTGLGDQVMEAVERAVLLATSSDITRAAVSQHGHDWTAERSVQLGLAVSGMLKGYTTTAASLITAMLKSVTRFTIQVLVALILGFFTLWDLPMISRGVASLRESRLAPVYGEVAPVLGVFGKLFGKALEAQARIAMANTALTALGMWALQIPGVGLLSLFVFVCSFIPIAGVIISTTPIGFVALTEYGFIKLALVILMVTGVHFVEAYALNPAIYSAHLKLHPLMVLCALVVAEHSLGVWGLLLAVPLTVFALDYLIRCVCLCVCDVGGERALLTLFAMHSVVNESPHSYTPTPSLPSTSPPPTLSKTTTPH